MASRDPNLSGWVARLTKYAARGRNLVTLAFVAVGSVQVGYPQTKGFVTAALTLTSLSMSIAYGLRTLIHVGLCSYACRHPGRVRLRRLLNTLLAVNALLTLAWIGFSIAILFRPSPPVQGLLSGVLYVALGLIAAQTTIVVRRLRMRTGSEALAEWPPIQCIRRSLRVGRRLPGATMLNRMFGHFRPRMEVSAFVHVALVVLATTSLLSVVPTAAGVVAWSARAGTPPDGKRQTADQRPPARDPLIQDSRRTPTFVPPTGPFDYEALCGRKIAPGDGAPHPQRAGIHRVWLGAGTGAGAVQAGCALRARHVRSRSNVWYSIGMCGAAVRSVAVATPTSSSLLYQQAAEFAMTKVESGELLGASERRSIFEGDAYVIQTTTGPFVLIRSRSSAGPVTPDPGSIPCERFTTRNVRYVTVPPGLIGAWLEIVRALGWIWPIEDVTNRGSGHDFVFRLGEDGAIVAHATCVTDIDCTVTRRGTIEAVSPVEITIDRIVALAGAKE